MSDVQVIKYKDDKTITPFYLKKIFLVILFIVLGFIIIAFVGFVTSSIFNFISYFYTTLYNSTKSSLSLLTQSLIEIDIQIKDAQFNQNSNKLDLISIANKTIYNTLIPAIRGNIFIYNRLLTALTLYNNKTIIDLQLIDNMSKGNYNLSHIIYSNNYIVISETILGTVESVTNELTSSLLSIDNANLSFSIISFLLSILLTPLLLIAISYLLISQLLYIRKIKGLNSTKFKRINELLLLDTFNNSILLHEFIEFCKLENMESNVYFWKDLQTFKNIFYQKDDDLKRKCAFEIYEKYIKKDSEMELLIPVEEKDSILNNLNNLPLNLFDKVENNIGDVLLNSHLRFKNESSD
jgi:hypothetical protein